MQALDDDDRAGIEQTIDDEVLKGSAIEFRSTSFGGRRRAGSRASWSSRARAHRSASTWRPARTAGSTGSAVVRQSDWGMKPYSALFGTLKVADEVEVVVEARPHAG